MAGGATVSGMPEPSPREYEVHESPAAADWSAARGAKWCAQVSGLEAMFSPVDEPLMDALQLAGPCRIAEVGCGGGGTTLALLRRAPAGSVVHGLDISAELVELARARPRPGGAIDFMVADMATATAPAPYDRLVSRFGVMFFADPRAAFANLLRWLAPEGRFAFAVWGRLSDNPWMSRVREAVARVIELPAIDPEAPGPFRYADPDKLLAVLEQAGFKKAGLDVRTWRGALPIGGGLPPAQAAGFALASFSAFGERLARAGGDASTEAHRAVTTCLADHHHDGVVRMRAAVHIVTGTRP